MIDMTGWMPHEGGDNPTLDKGEEGEAPAVRVLMRGRPTGTLNGGPRESGPSPSTAFAWPHSPEFPAGDILGWRLDSDPAPFARYDHVRKDMGR